jgi:HD superfamily phosphohydrolase YqeK
MTAEEVRIRQFREFLKLILCGSVINDIELHLKELDFFNKPASVKYHGQNTGDLFHHSIDVAQSLVDLTRKLDLKWERASSPYIVGLFHDLCKCDNYISTDYVVGTIETDGKTAETVTKKEWNYNDKMILNGHGEKSVIMVQKFYKLTDEEIACIRWHMGAFDEKDNWKHYSYAVSQYPNVLYTHTADMIASQIHNI